MKKFIKGTFELDQNIVNEEEYFQFYEPHLNEIIEWAEEHGIAMRFGVSDNNKYLCEYKVTGNTKKICKEFVADIKRELKAVWPKARSILEISGEQVF